MKAETVWIVAIALVGLTGVWPANAAAHATGVCTAAAQVYWKQFREAARRGNGERVADLGLFPFKLKPTLDSSKETLIDRNDFIKQFAELTMVDSGLNSKPTTMKSMVEKNKRLSTRFCNAAGNQFRVGGWLFRLEPQGWRFVEAAVD